MYLIRRAKIDDVPTLLKLARMVHFINLPADKEILGDKVMRSRQSFLRAAELARDGNGGGAPPEAGLVVTEGRLEPRTGGAGLAEVTTAGDLFMFVLEELGAEGGEGGGGVLGTSQIISKMGGPGHPNLSLRLRKREFFSHSLQQGASHMTAQLVLDETGPTEIGGLILQPSVRGHPMKLGRLLSLVRFHFIALNRAMFSDRILAEMMGPLSADGRSTMWEYLGRRFINLTYEEADRFCQYSKEFMLNLLPREEIYLTLLPPEARAVVGQVGPETLPARRMLEKLGFEYKDLVDPFDGGPNLEAKTDEISIVKQTRRGEIGEPCAAGECDGVGIVSVMTEDGEFRAVQCPYAEDRRGGGRVRVTRATLKMLEAEPGMAAGVTPMEAPAETGGKRARGGNGKKRKSRQGAGAER